MAVVPEAHKRFGVSYAFTDDGLELPVIDVTHPAFAIAPTDAEIEALAAQLREMMDRQRDATEEQRAAMRAFLGTSIIGRGMLAGTGTFLSGLSTYLMKIGPDNLGAYAIELDRNIARALGPTSMRMRLQNVVGFLAEALAPALEATPGAPLHLVNIAGGPAIDSLNALIVLRRDHPTALEGRAIHIHVFDQDTGGPSFGARAMGALLEPGAKLHGLDLTFRRVPYDWRHTDTLARELSALDLGRAVWAASSEGGLFEYGSDAEIVANLDVLRAAGKGATVSGTVTRDDGPAALSRQANYFATIPRTLATFEAIAAKAGWVVDRSIAVPYSIDVRLRQD
jgi:hypothetical protein